MVRLSLRIVVDNGRYKSSPIWQYAIRRVQNSVPEGHEEMRVSWERVSKIELRKDRSDVNESSRYPVGETPYNLNGQRIKAAKVTHGLGSRALLV